MKLFHRIDSLDKLHPIFLRVANISAVSPSAIGSGCTVYMTGGETWNLDEMPEEVLKACGYNATPSTAVNADATLILAGALRAEHESARQNADRTHNYYGSGYADGLQRAIEIAEGREGPTV